MHASLLSATSGAGASSDLVLLIVFVSAALAISFLCSILEAALLSTREAELEERASRQDAGAEKLLKIKKERLDDAISAILILNTIAHTAGVAGAGLQAGKIWTDSPFMLGVIFPSVLTLLILVGTEIIPKTLGAVHAGRLVRPVGTVLGFLLWSMTPFLFLTRLVTGALTSHEQTTVSRGELAAMVAMAARQGTLARQDSRLVANALRFNTIHVEDVMTPRTVVTMLPENATLAEFLAQAAEAPYSRIPLFGDDRDHVIGYVVRHELLVAAAQDSDHSRTLDSFRRDILFIDEDISVSAAMGKLIDSKEHLAVVTDSYGGMAGLVTLEDLVETLLGVEIIDESDKVADLRKEAVALRERRLKNRSITRDGQPAASKTAPGSEAETAES